MKHLKKLKGPGCLLLACCLLAACGAPAATPGPSSPAQSAPSSSQTPQTGPPPAEEAAPPAEGDDITPTDYANPDNWMVVSEAPALPVDVFCLYPTTYSPGAGEGLVADIGHEGMRQGALVWMAEKASAFETAGNFFAPYYRQLDAGYLLSLPREEQDRYIRGVPKTDALAAFDYYIQNFNESRPFLLVSHSQGSSMSKEILFDYLKENPDVAERMVAAYVIGYSVTQQELDANPHVDFAEGPDDTGVIISYNTEAPGMEGDNTVWLEGSVAINPISWTRTDAAAPAEESLGSLLTVDGELTPMDHLADARVDTERGVVVCGSVDVETYSMPEEARAIFPKGVYHGYDIPFYYYNLRQNAENRVAQYLAKTQS